jgi:hypothetical protein
LCGWLLRVRRARTLSASDPLRDDEHYNDACADHHAFDARSVLVTVQGSSLCAARACARPAGLDGACAQIRSWQSRDGRRGDDAKLG